MTQTSSPLLSTPIPFTYTMLTGATWFDKDGDEIYRLDFTDADITVTDLFRADETAVINYNLVDGQIVTADGATLTLLNSEENLVVEIHEDGETENVVFYPGLAALESSLYTGIAAGVTVVDADDDSLDTTGQAGFELETLYVKEDNGVLTIKVTASGSIETALLSDVPDGDVNVLWIDINSDDIDYFGIGAWPEEDWGINAWSDLDEGQYSYTLSGNSLILNIATDAFPENVYWAIQAEIGYDTAGQDDEENEFDYDQIDFASFRADAAVLPQILIESTDTEKTEGDADSTAFTFTLTRDGATSGAAQVDWNLSGSGVYAADAQDFVLPTYAEGFTLELLNGATWFTDHAYRFDFTASTIQETCLVNSEASEDGLDSYTVSDGALIVNGGTEDAGVITVLSADSDSFTAELDFAGEEIETVTFYTNQAALERALPSAIAGVTLQDEVDDSSDSLNRGGFELESLYVQETSEALVIELTAAGDIQDALDSSAPLGYSNILWIGVNDYFEFGLCEDGCHYLDKHIYIGGEFTPGMRVAEDYYSYVIDGDSITLSIATEIIPENDYDYLYVDATVGYDSDDPDADETEDDYPYDSIELGARLADASEDYVLSSGTVYFSAGETSKSITVEVAGDTDLEPDEGFRVSLSNPVNLELDSENASAYGTILNDDSAFSIVATDAEKYEGDSGGTEFVFSVTRSGFTDEAVSVDWFVPLEDEGNAASMASESDFDVWASDGEIVWASEMSGTVDFGVGQTEQTITIVVQGDTAAEADEDFAVCLIDPVTGESGSEYSAIGTIWNDDVEAAELSIIASDAIYEEGDDGETPFTFVVTRTGDTSDESSAQWMVEHIETDSDDFIQQQGTVVFAPGETEQLVTVYVAGDTEVEADEEFAVELYPSTGAIIDDEGGHVAFGTIINDDTEVTIEPLDAVKYEGDSGATAFTFTVMRTGFSGETASVDWSVPLVWFGGSSLYHASQGDFVGNESSPSGVLSLDTDISGTVAFGVGETEQTITLEVQGDTDIEADENFQIHLTNPVNVSLGSSSSADGTILTDDGAPVISIYDYVSPATLEDTRKYEGDSETTAFNFTAIRSGDTSAESTAWWCIEHTDTDANDFYQDYGEIVFAPGSTEETVTVYVSGDTEFEADENFEVLLCDAASAVIHSTLNSGFGTILNDDTNHIPQANDDTASTPADTP